MHGGSLCKTYVRFASKGKINPFIPCPPSLDASWSKSQETNQDCGFNKPSGYRGKNDSPRKQTKGKTQKKREGDCYLLKAFLEKEECSNRGYRFLLRKLCREGKGGTLVFVEEKGTSLFLRVV